MPRRGLPESIAMRHDEHYVEALAASAGAPVGRIVPIDLIDPNPNQPRQVMGDLSELMASVAEKGVIEPLIVRQRGGRYQIIGTTTAMMTISIIIALAAPRPIWLRVKAWMYMKVAGTSLANPGPPPVSDTTRSKLLIAMCARIMKLEKNTGRRLGRMIRQ